MTHKKGRLNKLFNKVFKGGASNRDRKLVSDWYEQLDLNPQEVFGDSAEEQQVWNKMRTNLYLHVHKERRQQTKVIPFLSWVRSAAALFFFCGLSFLIYFGLSVGKNDAFVFNIVSGNQSIRKFTLPDGTKVTLNLSSSLSWDKSYNVKTRKVTLKGEAFFDVKKDRKHPFIVTSNSIETKVLGTAFDVESYPSESQVKVSLVRGKVRISDQNNHLNNAVLIPGQMMDYSRKTGKLKVKPIAVTNIDAWTKGGLTFNDIPLASALERLARRYHFEIKYDPQKVKDRTVTASFDAVSWQEALRSILFTHDMNYTLKENTIYITNNP